MMRQGRNGTRSTNLNQPSLANRNLGGGAQVDQKRAND
jgi:hypothetical protein